MVDIDTEIDIRGLYQSGVSLWTLHVYFDLTIEQVRVIVGLDEDKTARRFSPMVESDWLGEVKREFHGR